MHNVQVSLENPDGLRLSVSVQVPVRNTPYENEARDIAEARANDDPSHQKYGPWTAKHSGFTS